MTDITTLGIEQLKAIAYDTIVLIEKLNSNLRLINTEIASRANLTGAPHSPPTVGKKQEVDS
jgi:hypothetical protein